MNLWPADLGTARLGEACALLAPLCWAVALVAMSRLALPAVSINLFKNSVAAALLAITCAALGVGVPWDRTAADWARLAASGVVGLAIADTLLLGALQRIGPGRLAVADATYAPMVVLFAWIGLGEHPGPGFLFGGALVVLGVLVAQWPRRDAVTLDAREVRVGFGMAVLAIAGTAAGVVLSKPVLEDGDLLEVTLTRLAFGLVGQVGMITVGGQWSEATTAFRDRDSRKTLLVATFVGTYLALVVWLGGFKWAPASTAAVLNQFGTVYLIALGGPLPARQLAGAGIAAAGALWVVAGG